MPWSEFKKEALQISGDYNARWLETEYNQTIANAQSVIQWEEFQKNKDLYPNLKYETVGDGRVRPEHRAWDGVIKPINDPWWSTHFPPNDWGCRCTVVQTDEDPTDQPTGGTQLKIEFANNPAKSGKIFPSSGYLTSGGLSPKDIENAGMFARKMFDKVTRYSKNYVSYLKYKRNPNYFDVAFDEKTGGMKAVHNLHKFDKIRGHYEKEVQEFFYKRGDSFVLEEENNIGKQIEGFLNRESCEIKSITGKSPRTIRKRIAESVEKGADIAILYFPNQFEIKILDDALDNYKGTLPKIIVLHDNKIIKDNR